MLREMLERKRVKERERKRYREAYNQKNLKETYIYRKK